MKYGICVALFVAFSASALLAEGIPSQSKLNSLGLSSLEVASDEAGEEVRGKFFGTFGFNFLFNGTNVTPGAFNFGTDAYPVGADQTASFGTFDGAGNVVPVTGETTTTVTDPTTGSVIGISITTFSFQGGLFAGTTIN